jgi:hypothetical protein
MIFNIRSVGASGTADGSGSLTAGAVVGDEQDRSQGHHVGRAPQQDPEGFPSLALQHLLKPEGSGGPESDHQAHLEVKAAADRVKHVILDKLDRVEQSESAQPQGERRLAAHPARQPMPRRRQGRLDGLSGEKPVQILGELRCRGIATPRRFGEALEADALEIPGRSAVQRPRRGWIPLDDLNERLHDGLGEGGGAASQ